MTDAETRRARREARETVKPGPQRRAKERRPVWQTALIGLAVIAGAFLIAFIVTGQGVEEMTETAPVDVTGDPLTPIPNGGGRGRLGRRARPDGDRRGLRG